MARRARWIRLGRVEEREFHAACAALAGSQGRAAAPIVLWACTRSSLGNIAPEIERQYRFVVIVPARLAPGRPARWVSWALSPVVAAYRDSGLGAYLDATDICLHGRRIGSGYAETIGECVVIASSLDGAAPVSETAVSAPEFRTWLREGLGLAMTQWGGKGGAPPERVLEAALRVRIEAQHGWQFESAWPTAREQAAIDEAQADFREPMFWESGAT